MALSPIIEFAPFRLDLTDERLWRGQEAQLLTSKAFAVLSCLVAHAGQLVTKAMLMDTVWPETAISESTLTGCIWEVRQALGDSARQPHYLETVHGRGYRFIGQVTEPAAPVAQLPAVVELPQVLPAPALPVAWFVGRDAELAQLARCWTRAQAGERHLVFVTGEPGIGKTALVDTFLGRLAGEATLDIARGQCVESFGAGEPYRPVLEALSRLGRGSRGPEVIAVLEDQAPTWLAQMPGLIGPAALERVHHRLTGVTRERMLRELAEALEGLTAQQPLVLVLEDLHWSDPSTLELLAVLARRRETARLLLLGTYRPPAGQRRSQPLETVLHELTLHGHSVALPVTVLTEDAIAAYLTRCMPGLAHVATLACLVHQHTEGNPLFMVTLVEAWQTEGVLRQQEGVWRLDAEVEGLRDQVPDNLRQLIDGQLDRLSAAEQRVLEVASVAGVEFEAQAVAAGLRQAVERVDEACAVLAQRRQWLRAVGEQCWPDGTVAGGYRFGHALYQQVLYRRLAAARRVQLHQRIGARVEEGYDAEAGTRAAELAVHFTQGRDSTRAVQYLRQAGNKAQQGSAHKEAITYFTTALEVLHALPETEVRLSQEIVLQRSLGVSLLAIRGFAAPEVAAAYSRARELCQRVGNIDQLFPVLFGLWGFHHLKMEWQRTRDLAEELLTLAHQHQTAGHLLMAHRALGDTLHWLGEFGAAREHLEQGIALYDAERHRSYAMLYGQDPLIGCQCYMAETLWMLGYPEQALRMVYAAIASAEQVGHPFSLANALTWSYIHHGRRREWQLVLEQAEKLRVLTEEQGFSQWLAQSKAARHKALLMLGQHNDLEQMRQGNEARRRTGARHRVNIFVGEAGALRFTGQAAEGLEVINQGLLMVEETGERNYETEVYRLKGELLLDLSEANQPEAENCFRQALSIARTQQAKSWELRAATSLARLWQSQDKCQDARELLAPVYNWFTEGLDTADLKDVKALLDELSEGAS